MANTQTTVPTFVDGQVLGGERLNQSAGTGVPVFATTVTRDAGFGGAGEKTLAEGQLCYLESTNVVQYYDGAAWATLGPAPAASSGLTYITTSNTTATTQQINSCFSATYDAYKVIISLPSTTTGALHINFCTGGTANTNSNYTYTFHGYNGSGFYGQGGTTNNSYGSLFQNFTSSGLYVADIVNPFKSTEKTYLVGNGMATSSYALAGGVCFNGTTSFDGIKLSNANIDSYNYVTTIYGYALS